MSTDNFDLAPAQAGATTTVPAPLAPAPAAGGPAPAPSAITGVRKTNTPAGPDTPTDGTLGGVLIPGGAITGLIGLCWLIHQFGLPAVILGILACAAAATAALVVKARRSMKRSPARRSGALRSAGGAGPGRTGTPGGASRTRTGMGSAGATRRPSAGPRPGGGLKGGLPVANRRPTTATTNKTPGGKPTGSASRKPNGLTGGKKTTGAAQVGRKNTTPKPTGSALGRGAAAIGGRSLFGRSPGSVTPKKTKTPAADGKGTGTSGKNRKNTPPTPSAKTGRLARILGRKTSAPAPLKPTTAKGHDKRALKPPTPTSPLSTKEAKHAKAAAKAARHNRGNTAVKAPKTRELKAARKQLATANRAPIGPARRGAYWVGKKLRKHTSKKLRRRIRRVVSPARTAVRTVSRIVSPPAAYTWRYGTRALLKAHMLLGTIRYTSAGPNWVRPLAKVLHAITSPAARALAATGSWGWLTRWMYRHTTPAKPLRPATTAPQAPTVPNPVSQAANVIHRAITSPGTTAPKGNPVSIEAAAPFEQAADVIRQAFANMAANPADSMVGFEAYMSRLADIQTAVAEGLTTAATVTEEAFKVNPAIADAYRDSSNYAQALADRISEVQGVYRSLHADQIDNYENPTPQGAKWDTSANN